MKGKCNCKECLQGKTCRLPATLPPAWRAFVREAEKVLGPVRL